MIKLGSDWTPMLTIPVEKAYFYPGCGKCRGRDRRHPLGSGTLGSLSSARRPGPVTYRSLEVVALGVGTRGFLGVLPFDVPPALPAE